MLFVQQNNHQSKCSVTINFNHPQIDLVKNKMNKINIKKKKEN